MGLIGDIKIRYSTLFYEKIPRLSGSTVPLGIRRMKTPPRKRGGGGHTSTCDKASIRLKDPENDPSQILFIPKTRATQGKTPVKTHGPPDHALKKQICIHDKSTP